MSTTTSRSATGARTSSCTSARSKTPMMMTWWITQARPSATTWLTTWLTRRPRSRWTWRTSTRAISTSSWATSTPRTWSTSKTGRRPHRRPTLRRLATSPRQPDFTTTTPIGNDPDSPTTKVVVADLDKGSKVDLVVANRDEENQIFLAKDAPSGVLDAMAACPMRPLAPSRCPTTSGPTTSGQTASSAPSCRRA